MRIRGRPPSQGAGGRPAVADGDGQAAWDAEGGPGAGGRRRLIVAAAVGLAALLLVGAVVVSQAGVDGDILALGAAPDPAGLSPVHDVGSLTEGVMAGDPSTIAPGDRMPAVPAGADPAAGSAAAAAPEAAIPAAAAAGATPAGGAVAPGPGPGAGIPIPTTRVGGVGSPTSGAPGTTAATVPAPQCAIAEATVNPSVMQNHRSQKLYGDVRVTFRPTGCGPADFQVRVNGLELAAAATVDGFYDAIIRSDAEKWSDGDHQITITGAGATTTAVLTVT